MEKDIKGLACLASRRWWNAAGTRALKTLAQAAIGAVVVNTIWDIDIHEMFGIAAIPAIVSLLTSLAGIPEAKEPESER